MTKKPGQRRVVPPPRAASLGLERLIDTIIRDLGTLEHVCIDQENHAEDNTMHERATQFCAVAARGGRRP